MSGKLHQLLASESDRRRTANAILEESIDTFKGRSSHFEGLQRDYAKKDDDGIDLPTERKRLVTTVNQRLQYTVKSWKTWLDVVLQKEETNAAGAARARIMIDDNDFGEFSATSLLAIEKNLTRFIEMLREVPTLDPSHEWELDASETDIYKSKFPEVTTKTQKKVKPITKYEATKEHPAQTEMISYDTTVGTWTAVRSSGKVTPAEKALMLGRAEELLIATKKARAKANDCGVVPVKSDNLFNYIIKGKV